jgi:TPR repeat protein
MSPAFTPFRPPTRDYTRSIVIAVVSVFGIALLAAFIRISFVRVLINTSSYREPVLVAHGVTDDSNIDLLTMVANSRILLFMAPWPSPLPSVESPKLTASAPLTSPIDSPEAAAVRAKAEAGDTASASKLGRIYYDGEGGVPINFNEALKWFQVAAQQGDAFSEDKLGEIYRDGYVVKADNAQALEWFHKAAAQGLPDAQDSIAWMNFYGEGLERDEHEATRWIQQALPGLQKGASEGDPECLGDLGDIYVDGVGAAPNDALAMSYYQKGAEMGDAYCEYSVGTMYEGGLVVPVNLATALAWYKKAAAQGQPDAQIGVAQLGQ